jgi:dienelactone hydrolase
MRRFLLVLVSSLALSPTVPSAARAQDIDDDIAEALKAPGLSMKFRGSTPAEFRAWQEKFRAKLNDLLGDSTPPREWTVRVEARKELSDHVRHQLLLQAKDVPSLPIYLLVPKGLKKDEKRPAVLCLHGHGRYGYDPIVGRTDFDDAKLTAAVKETTSRLGYDYGRQFVRRGYVVVAPCMIPFGRRVDHDRYGRNDPCAIVFARLQALGELPLTRNLRDLRWCLDFLQSRSEVRSDRIGCAGLSYGGRTTMYLTAIDTRIQVAAPSGVLNLLEERISRPWGCGAQIIPGLLKYGDHPEIGSLIAPRPCVWEAGSVDPLLPAEPEAEFRVRLKRAYKAAGVPENLRFDDFEGGHRWQGRVAYTLFDEILKR